MRFIFAFFMFSVMVSCAKEESATPEDVGFNQHEDFLILEDGESSTRLNPIKDTHWFKGEIVTDGVKQPLKGVFYDDSVLSQIRNVTGNDELVKVDYEFGTVSYTNFALIEGGIQYVGIDSDGNLIQEVKWKNELLAFDKSSPLANQFKDMYLTFLSGHDPLHNDPSVSHKLLWPCVVGAGIVATGGAIAASIAHCNNVIATVANNCNACVEASFCAASCVACPPDQ